MGGGGEGGVKGGKMGGGGGVGGFDGGQRGGGGAGSGSNQSKTNQERIKGTEKASPIHTLIHK